MKTITLIVEENNDGFWAQLKGYPNVFSQGDTLDELKTNALEALSIYLEEQEKPFPPSVQFAFVFDIREFFEINDYINITKLAERSGINPSLLRQYAKGIKYPGEQQIKRIQATIRKVGIELTNSSLTSTIN